MIKVGAKLPSVRAAFPTGGKTKKHSVMADRLIKKSPSRASITNLYSFSPSKSKQYTEKSSSKQASGRFPKMGSTASTMGGSKGLSKNSVPTIFFSNAGIAQYAQIEPLSKSPDPISVSKNRARRKHQQALKIANQDSQTSLKQAKSRTVRKPRRMLESCERQDEIQIIDSEYTKDLHSATVPRNATSSIDYRKSVEGSSPAPNFRSLQKDPSIS